MRPVSGGVREGFGDAAYRSGVVDAAAVSPVLTGGVCYFGCRTGSVEPLQRAMLGQGRRREKCRVTNGLYNNFMQFTVSFLEE